MAQGLRTGRLRFFKGERIVPGGINLSALKKDDAEDVCWFVVESVSVIIQVASYKMTGRRIFRMAPLHHHFELKGWPEPKVIVRFWIITVILVLIGLASLKIR